MTPSDLKALSDADWAQLIRDIQAEATRRDTLATAQQTMDQAATAYATAVQSDAPIPAASLPCKSVKCAPIAGSIFHV